MPKVTPAKSLIINNFKGSLTRYNYGDINSGFAKYSSTFGDDPFSKPGNLTWHEQATQIDPSGLVITDLIVAGKERVESGISYVYAVGHLGRVYKIQVNDPTTYNPNYDNPVLLTTLAINSPTFKRGGSIDFFGATEKIYIGHDMGATTVNFDGSGEAFVGVLGSWTQNVPRPSKQFAGSIFFGNGSNIAQIDSTATVTTYSKLSPAFPINTQTRDIDTSIDGNYLEMVVTRLALPDITSSAVDTTVLSNSESYIFKWNGTDLGYTTFDAFPAFSLNANITFGNNQYTFGYDLAGCAVFNPVQKILSPILSQAPIPNAVGSNGNIVGWFVPEFVQGFLRASLFIHGSLDEEVRNGWWRQFQQPAQGSETDVLRVPFQLIVSNLVIGSVTNGYQGGVAGSGKLYFSTFETSAAPTAKYKFYRFFPVPTRVGTSVQGVYETQTQPLSGKDKIGEVRMYTEPLVAGNSFLIDMIGSNGNPIPGASKTFTVGSNVTAGQDFVWYTAQSAPTYAVGLRVSNLGAVNWTLIKAEIDHSPAGK